MRKGRRLLLAVAAFLLVVSGGDERAHSQPSPSSGSEQASRAPELAAAVRAIVHDRALKDAQIGVVIMDVETGNIVASSGEHLVLNPASNAKLYTAAAALAMLKATHRYQTTLSGTVQNGGVSGLVLRGRGDPSLRSRDLWQMALELKAHGVRRVDGDIFVDQKFFDEQTTPPAFEQQPNEWASFRAPVSAVALNGNTVTLTVRPTTTGQPATAWFDPPGFVDVDGTVKTGEDGADAVILELSPSGKRLAAKLGGTVGADAKLVRYTRRVDDPRLLPGYALKAIFDEAGIKVGGDVKLGSGEKGTVIARHESEPLSTLLYALGKNSDNFYAEMIFKSIAAETKARPAKSQDASAIVAAWLAKNDLGDAGLVVKNGSGLFDSNRTTAFSVAKLLRYCWQDPTIRNEFVAQLAIGGVDGTLHKRFRNTRARRAVRAKTGTLDDAIALSGYVLGPTGKNTLAFSILFNHVAGHAASARMAADKLVELIYERQWK
ncbi:MAG TPA: D-alanyl-D-alanine carboxypeptidase/D-alanyl-D-alanine-endopeptidase [Labilithrix sp.]|jgi:D-alanyl-D-alanine carboxypeptidase/D-alanyl-D-alanine-endopeptidase (penicillin-binding protein 4)|nr:D-alanyl-D-alanine carboxypeptidase/D-alanyl-D-alanine-endopeptidase [Labilithrix sp.]